MKRYVLPTLALIIISSFIIMGLAKVTFDSLLPTGKVTDTRVEVYLASPADCDFIIPSGTSQVSFYCIANGVSVNDVLENITFTELRTYDATDSSDPWKINNPSLPSWVVNDLEYLQRTEGYYITTTISYNYLYHGSRRVPNDIPLATGWNFVGYPTNVIREISTSLATINGNYDEVRSYDNNGTYETYIPPGHGTLNQTEPYRAYWIDMSSADIWTVS